MKKIFQLFLVFISVLISLTSCSSYPYTEDDETMGFGPIGDTFVEKQSRFKTDERYNIHEGED